MDFSCQSFFTSSGFFVIVPFLVLLVCWWILTVVLSNISVISSTRACSIRTEKICSNTTAFVQTRNWLYTLYHSLNRSSKPLHGTLIFSQYTIALSIFWLIFPDHPPCGFFLGANKLWFDFIVQIFEKERTFFVKLYSNHTDHKLIVNLVPHKLNRNAVIRHSKAIKPVILQIR